MLNVCRRQGLKRGLVLSSRLRQGAPLGKVVRGQNYFVSQAPSLGRIQLFCSKHGGGDKTEQGGIESELPHVVLEVKAGASQAEIKRKFLELAHRYHPDKGTGNAAKFMKIRKAFELLSDGKVGLVPMSGLFRFRQKSPK